MLAPRSLPCGVSRRRRGRRREERGGGSGITTDRCHLLDLRRSEPENPRGYRWGWIDRDDSLLVASFLILRDFIELEDPQSPAAEIRRLEREGDPLGWLPELRERDAALRELRSLYEWWIRDRFEERRRWAEEERRLADAIIPGDPESLRVWKAHYRGERDREDEMLGRLVLARRHMISTL